MAKWQTIYDPLGCYGGCTYRVTSDGNKCNLQESLGGYKRFKTIATVTRQEWDEYAKEWDIYNITRISPSHVVRVLNAVAEGGLIFTLNS